jgi:hypothetical protein
VLALQPDFNLSSMKAILKKTVNYEQSYRSSRHNLTIGWRPIRGDKEKNSE